jgi:hypothetical protein
MDYAVANRIEISGDDCGIAHRGDDVQQPIRLVGVQIGDGRRPREAPSPARLQVYINRVRIRSDDTHPE